MDAIELHAGPSWLQEQRAAAAARARDAALPSAQEEVWRYSRVDELDLEAFEPVPEALAVEVALPDEWRERGATVRHAAEIDAAPEGLFSWEPDTFATLSHAIAADALVVDVPRGVHLDEPLTITTHISGTGVVVAPRLAVRVAEGASAVVVERTTSGADALLSLPVTTLSLERGARLRFASLQQLGTQAWQIASLAGDVAQEANLQVGLIALGGEYARLRTDCTLAGRGANGDLLAAYFGDGDQTLDFRTFQHHDAPDTTSNLLFKGAVGGRSRSVYTGLIRVDKAARGTNAFQTNRNVKLSDDAWAESVPNLEIETNDVRCSHASTVGPVDPEQRFYLESRGVPPTMADRLIVAGFFDEVVRQLPVVAVADEVTGAIADKLDRVAEDLR